MCHARSLGMGGKEKQGLTSFCLFHCIVPKAQHMSLAHSWSLRNVCRVNDKCWLNKGSSVMELRRGHLGNPKQEAANCLGG